MKLMSIILSFAILLTGCYSHTTVAKHTRTVDATAIGDATLTFRLHNGSYIISEGGKHQRIENGYMVVGSLAVKDVPGFTDFSGIVRDDQIKEVTTSTLNVGLTVLAVGLAGAIVVAAVVAGISRQMSTGHAGKL